MDARIPRGGIRSRKALLRKAPLRNDLQSINGNNRKGTNMDNEHNEMIEKSSENCSESSCCCGTRHKKRT